MLYVLSFLYLQWEHGDKVEGFWSAKSGGDRSPPAGNRSFGCPARSVLSAPRFFFLLKGKGWHPYPPRSPDERRDVRLFPSDSPG